jgi:hypothetical protein
LPDGIEKEVSEDITATSNVKVGKPPEVCESSEALI